MTARGTLVKEELPRQKDLDSQPGDVLELVQLAAVASAEVNRRRKPARAADDMAFTGFPVLRRPTWRRTAVVWLLLAVAGAAVAFVATSLTSGSAAPAPAVQPARPVVAPPTTPAGALGVAAGRRLREGGGAVNIFICQAAYSTDAAASAGALPSADVRSTVQDDYIAGCMSDMSAR